MAPAQFSNPAATEEARLRELYRYEILGTPPDPVFDDLARLAAQVCDTPMAVISFMDRERQWFKSRYGLNVSEYPRENSFCAQVICEDDLFVVPDPADDGRFTNSPAVLSQDEQARFYAGAPLRVPSGHVLGALSVLDRCPRKLTADQRESLRALGRQVVAQLELRRSIAELKRAAEERAHAQAALHQSERRFQDFMDHSPILAFIKDDYGRYVYVNQRVADQFQRPASEWIGRTDQDILSPGIAREVQEHDLSVFNDGQMRILEEFVPTPGGQTRHWLSHKFLLVDGDGSRQLGGLSVDITDRKLAEQERERLVAELQEALAQVKTLKGFLPICASCKNIRDDEGYWQQIESYLCEHADVEFTHGICPACLEKLYPDFVAFRSANPAEEEGER